MQHLQTSVLPLLYGLQLAVTTGNWLVAIFTPQKQPLCRVASRLDFLAPVDLKGIRLQLGPIRKVSYEMSHVMLGIIPPFGESRFHMPGVGDSLSRTALTYSQITAAIPATPPAPETNH